MIKDSNGTIRTQEEEVLGMWKDFFQDLLNREDRNDEQEREQVHAIDIEIEEPTLDGVKRAIQKLKNNKTPGIDNISAELLKNGGQTLEFQMHRLILKIWRKEEIPMDWDTGIIIPVHKKGDKSVCGNYRGITMLSVCYKVLTIIIKEKLEPYIVYDAKVRRR